VEGAGSVALLSDRLVAQQRMQMAG
jgi:hypothetical protein